jgi:hypothetical protein
MKSDDAPMPEPSSMPPKIGPAIAPIRPAAMQQPIPVAREKVS